MLVNFADRGQVNVSDARINALAPYANSILTAATGGSYGNFSDASEAGTFMISQLAHVEQEVYEVQRVMPRYAELMPITSEAGSAANSIVYQIMDWAGQFKRVNSNARDLPRVEVGYADVTLNVAQGGGSYEYNVQEMVESAFLRRPLNVARAQAADSAWQQHLNNVALIGETNFNLYGLLNMNTVPSGNAPVGAWGGGTTTEVQVLSDLCYGLLTVYQNSAYNDYITDILVPVSVMNYLSRAFIGTNAFVSLIKFFQENNMAYWDKKAVINFTPLPQLETMGSGSTRRVVFYKKDPSRLKFHSTQNLTFLAPQPQGLSIVMNGYYRYGGLQVTYPKSMYYMDAI
jgi:hypothetical protein